MNRVEIESKLNELKDCQYLKIILDDNTIQIVENFAIDNIPQKECIFYKVGFGDRFDYARIVNILPNTRF